MLIARSTASGWQCAPQRYFLNLECAGEERQLNITSSELQNITLDRNELQITENGIRKRIPVLRKDDQLYLEWAGQLQAIRQVDSIARAEADNQQQGGLTATMNGIVVEVLVQPGDQVEEGATLVILEAMKMEHSIQAPYSGTVSGVFCTAGDLVEEGLALVELDGGTE